MVYKNYRAMKSFQLEAILRMSFYAVGPIPGGIFAGLVYRYAIEGPNKSGT
jgi:hypothetical protein